MHPDDFVRSYGLNTHGLLGDHIGNGQHLVQSNCGVRYTGVQSPQGVQPKRRATTTRISFTCAVFSKNDQTGVEFRPQSVQLCFFFFLWGGIGGNWCPLTQVLDLHLTDHSVRATAQVTNDAISQGYRIPVRVRVITEWSSNDQMINQFSRMYRLHFTSPLQW